MLSAFFEGDVTSKIKAGVETKLKDLINNKMNQTLANIPVEMKLDVRNQPLK